MERAEFQKKSVELSQQETSRPIGLVAGNGVFPLEFAKNALNAGRSVIVVAHCEETDPALSGLASELTWVRFGQLGRAIRFLKKHKVKEVAFLGGIKRERLFHKVRLDWIALKIVASAKSFRDDAMLRAVALEYEKNGFSVISPAVFLPESCISAGTYTKRSLTKDELLSAQLGWQAASLLGSLDTGQTVVVNQRVIVALEAVEGTDATIRRAGEVSGVGSVVVKLPKPIQDRRLDLPGVGLRTIEQMKQAGATCLILQSRGALLLHPQEVIRAANAGGIAIEVFDSLESLEHKLCCND
jgi:UDP-2,3-diacylglucosamine hydrolase